VAELSLAAAWAILEDFEADDELFDEAEADAFDCLATEDLPDDGGVGVCRWVDALDFDEEADWSLTAAEAAQADPPGIMAAKREE